MTAEQFEKTNEVSRDLNRYDFAEAYSQAENERLNSLLASETAEKILAQEESGECARENERLRGCLNSITAALGVKQSKQGLTAFERELRSVVRAALRPEQRKDGEK